MNSAEGIAAELNGIIARMADRYYLTFPGYDEDERVLAVRRQEPASSRVDQTDVDPVTLDARLGVGAAGEEWVPWLAVLLSAGGLLTLDHHHQGRFQEEGGADADAHTHADGAGSRAARPMGRREQS